MFQSIYIYVFLFGFVLVNHTLTIDVKCYPLPEGRFQSREIQNAAVWRPLRVLVKPAVYCQ